MLHHFEILPIDEDTAEVYGKIKAKLITEFAHKEKEPRKKFKLQSLGIKESNLWLAASSIQNFGIVVSAGSEFHMYLQKASTRLRLENWLS